MVIVHTERTDTSLIALFLARAIAGRFRCDGLGDGLAVRTVASTRSTNWTNHWTSSTAGRGAGCAGYGRAGLGGRLALAEHLGDPHADERDAT